ncbi:RNA polymerase sigma factor [Neobacillus muris]|uniref:RNA polymerase sigma factor n=1 Tax=Neobacillus muris TaxID=2941334 RepID=UPI003B96B0ED
MSGFTYITKISTIFLRGIKEFSVSETASILNWNENKVRITYHRALKKLQKSMGGFFYE